MDKKDERITSLESLVEDLKESRSELYIKIDGLNKKVATLKTELSAERKEKLYWMSMDAKNCKKLTDAEATLTEKDAEITDLCNTLQHIHDFVPHGTGIHQTIRDELAKHPRKEPGQAKPDNNMGALNPIRCSMLAEASHPLVDNGEGNTSRAPISGPETPAPELIIVSCEKSYCCPAKDCRFHKDNPDRISKKETPDPKKKDIEEEIAKAEYESWKMERD
jgi:hypothetical protein